MRTFNEIAIGERWDARWDGVNRHFVKTSHDGSRECDADGWIACDGKSAPDFGAAERIDLRFLGPPACCSENPPLLGLLPDSRGWEWVHHVRSSDITHWRPHKSEKAAPAATTPNPDMRPDSDRERAYRLKQEAEKEQAKLQREKEAAARKSEGDGLTTVAPTPRFGWLGGLR